MNRKVQYRDRGEPGRLHMICLDGLHQDLHRALQQTNRDINTPNNNGLMPIHVAVYRPLNDLSKIFELLHKHGAHLNARTMLEGDTVLHLLIRHVELSKAEDAILTLLQLGADPAITNMLGRTPADESLLRNYQYLNDLLTRKISLDEARDVRKKYRYDLLGDELIQAIRDGDDASIDRLIVKNANVNYRNKNGAAPIHYAVTHYVPIQNKSALVAKLLNAGADVNLTDYENDSALNLVIKTEALRENGVMHELVDVLLKAGADAHIKDLDGHDALMIATERTYDDVIELLTQQGMKKLRLAVEQLDLNAIDDALRQPGVAINVLHQDGLGLLHSAVLRTTDLETKKSILTRLLENRADINLQCQPSGNTILHLAIEQQDIPLAKFIMSKNIDKTIKNKDGDTASMLALKLIGGNKDVQKLLKDENKSECTLL